ncbi:hypothetical protein C8R45DRAFT_970626, partial [Mycena sanguinolenta]
MDREMAMIYIGGGMGGNGGSGGQEGGEGGKGEGPRFEHITINIQQCYVNSDQSGLINLPAPDLPQAVPVRKYSTANLTVPNVVADAAQSTQDATDETAGTFRESKEYDITIVLRPIGLALQAENPMPYFPPNELTAHELVAWKVIRLSTEKDGTFVHLPTHLAFGDVNEDQGILGHDSFCFAPPRTLVTRTDMGFWKSAQCSNPRLGEFVLATNEAFHPVDFALGTYHAELDGAEDQFSPFLVIRDILNGGFCIAPHCKDLMVNAYITQNIRERQIFSGPFNTADGSDSHHLGDSPDAANLPKPEDETYLASKPQPTREVGEDDRTLKIISAPLLGKNGRLVSSLAQRTRWLLVNKGQNLELKIVD